MVIRHLRVGIALGFCILAAAAMPANSESRFRSYLVETIGLDNGELSKLVEGEVIATVVDVDDDWEIVTVGVARLEIPKEFFVERLESMAGYRNREDVLSFQKIGDKPTPSDFADFELPKDDIKSLEKCKLGECDVKVTEAALDQLQKEGDSGNPGPNAIVQDMLYRRADTYTTGGLDALDPLVDKKDPRRISDAVDGLLAKSEELYRYLPELHEYLREYPKNNLKGASDVLYWSVEDFGMKPTAFLKHLVIYDPSDEASSGFVAGLVSVYASHYFDGLLNLVAWVEAEIDNEGPTGYVVMVERGRFDGKVTGLKRSKLNGRLKDALRENLKSQRDDAEAAYNASR